MGFPALPFKSSLSSVQWHGGKDHPNCQTHHQESHWIKAGSISCPPGTAHHTPNKQTTSPATLLMGRTLCTTMPNIKFTRATIQPECNDRKQVMRELPELQPGDSVRVLYGKVIKGRVIRKSKYPKSYLVLTENGTKVRRDRRHLLRAKETIMPPEIDYENIVPQHNVPNAVRHQNNQHNPASTDTGPSEQNNRTVTRTKTGRRVKTSSRYDDFDTSRWTLDQIYDQWMIRTCWLTF